MEIKHYDDYKRLGLNIAYYRKLKGLTQQQLAEKIGISRTHMSNIEAPNVNVAISLARVFDVAYALDVDVSRLFEIRK